MNSKNQNSTLKTFRFKRFVRKSYSVFNSIHKAVTIGVLSGCALMSAHAASVNPAEGVIIQTKSDTIPEKELDEVVVTASKAALPLNMAAKMVTVITSNEIERAPVKSIEDLLAHYSGVDILQRGPHGVQADISLRGGSFDQTAILLNGINLTNPQTGHYSFDIPINLSDIDRIEILQGPSSLVFGASAFSGGINIITKKDTKSGASAKIESGMHGLFGAEARGAYKARNAVHRLSAGYKHSDGYIRNSDYNIVNLLWQSSFGVNGANIDMQAGLNDKKYGAGTFYSAAFPNQYDDTRGVFASVKGETHGKLKFIPQLYWSRHYDVYHLFRPGTPDLPAWYTAPNYHRSDVYGMNLNMQYASRWGITSFGGEFRNEGILSSNLGRAMREKSGNYTKWDNRSNISFFAEHNFVFDKLTLSLGGLYNYNTALADTLKADGFYPAVNASYRATNALSLYASWSKATRMPTFTDLYYSAGEHRGFAGLTPEYTQSGEAGIRFRSRTLTANVNGFISRGDNLIDWVFDTGRKLYFAKNTAQTTTAGVGADVLVNAVQWLGARQPIETFGVSYQHMRQGGTDVGDNNPISSYVHNYLRHKFTASLHHRVVRNLTLSWNFRWQSRAGSYFQYVDLVRGNRVNYRPFSILDVKANYALRQLNIFANINNLFNTTHVDFGNIPQPGFWLTGGVSYTISD
ncbi:MAG: TonB-dependent receptor [Bacteroidia bacterium]|nr:TonB-dependent receptor [Bacteroidia bacterium]